MITAERLRELLDYDAESGVFSWRTNRGGGARAGDVAGSVTKRGYRNIHVDGVKYRGCRLAWLHAYGEWPEHQVDHRNGIRDDNRLANLRGLTNGQNSQNVNRPSRNNSSGYLGVFPKRKVSLRWGAQIRVDGRKRHIGYFDTPEKAHAAYLAAKRELHPYWEPQSA